MFFKAWKSFFQIHHNLNIKKERLECHIYEKLIMILLYFAVIF
ncbi:MULTISPECIES: hypothetical protein [Bacillus cereus group]